MSQSAEEIRAEIESTRRELGQDVDALADKVSPSKIVDRQKNKLRGALSSVKDRVMGAADDTATSVKDAGHSAGAGIKDAGHTVAYKTQGNPLAAGVIALGAGWLLGSLMPASEKERAAASAVKEKAQPVVQEAQSVAKEAAENLKEPARESLESVKGTAQDAVATVKSEGQWAAEDVKGSAQDAKDTVQEQAGNGSGGSSGQGAHTGYTRGNTPGTIGS